MPKLTALLHCHNQAQQLARALETLRACDQVLVIDHDANSDVERVVRDYGATIKVGVPGVSLGTYLVDAANDWIICVKPTETLSEELEASLLEWKQQEHETNKTFAISVRAQQNGGWKPAGRHTRLVNRTHVNWTTELPPDSEGAEVLQGDLLELETPAEPQQRSA
jgi:hypothetical protein